MKIEGGISEYLRSAEPTPITPELKEFWKQLLAAPFDPGPFTLRTDTPELREMGLGHCYGSYNEAGELKAIIGREMAEHIMN